MNTENVTTLKIHKLTQEQYDREYAAGRIDETAIYLTPDDRSYLDEYATKSYAETLAETVKSQLIASVTAGKGLTGGGATGNITLNIGAGSGITVADDAISVNTSYVTSGKNYKVQVDSTSGGLFVNVPWTDNNTTYSEATTSAAGLLSAADKTKIDSLGSAAYNDMTFFAAKEHTHDYLSITGGSVSGRVYSSISVGVGEASFRNINIVSPNTNIEAGVTAIPTGEIWIKYE